MCIDGEVCSGNNGDYGDPFSQIDKAISGAGEAPLPKWSTEGVKTKNLIKNNDRECWVQEIITKQQ